MVFHPPQHSLNSIALCLILSILVMKKNWSGFVSVRLIKDYLEDAPSVLILMDISDVS